MLGVTREHPFWVVGKNWVDAGDLALGDQVSNIDGGILVVKTIEIDAELQNTYNFEVADFHTYFVGEQGAWVHNNCDVANSGLKRAEALRDAELLEISKLSKTKQSKITTVVGAHDPATGRVAVGVKVTCRANAGKCAEDLASEALGNPKNIEFTKVIRPRNENIIPRCDRCVGNYGPE